jgi:hypothetical protein
MYAGAAIGVVIPALNEEASLPLVLAALPAWVDRVVVVDNGSTDATADVALQAGAVVVREPRRGYGRACRAGIEALADAVDVLAFLDGDFSDRPEQIDRVIAPIVDGRADLVIGSRVRGRRARGALTLPQRWGNALACLLIRWFWGYRYTDLGPFRAVRVAALDGLRMDDRTYGWTIQMQIRAVRAGLRVSETPVDYRRRIGRSKISGTIRGTVGAGTKILSTVIRERMRAPPAPAFLVRPEHLIVFTRYPEAGRTKTRLIPALGATAAAELQRDMTIQTLLTTERLRFTREVSAEVRFAGGDRVSRAEMFGGQHTCFAQRGGDLGTRIYGSLAEAFARGAQRAIVVGTDCPALDCTILNTAFEALRSYDCVIGPTRDGGYYLIGLRRPCRRLFTGIPWGSSSVLDESLRRGVVAGLTVHQLLVLRDVDEQRDFPEWQQRRCPRISVIIPAHNEAEYIGNAIESARAAGVEVLIVDGGSIDDTARIARAAGARVVRASAGRADSSSVRRWIPSWSTSRTPRRLACRRYERGFPSMAQP